MSDVSKLKINNVTYNIKDSLALRDAPSDGEEYVRKNGAWEISSGGESDSIVFGDDSVIIQPGEGVGFYGDAINFENGSAIITTSERTIKNLWDIVADSFTTTVSYSTDDYVIHEENLYQFITDHPAGEWNDEDVVITTIEDGLNSDSGGNSGGEGGKAKVMYFYEQTVNTATNAEIFRITDPRINTDTVVLECTFANPEYITGKTSWISYEGYIAFTGTCTTVTTANVTLAYKSEENISNRLLTLLWENPDPTASSFAGQTINNLELSSYDFFIVKVLASVNNTIYQDLKDYIIVQKGVTKTINEPLGAMADTSNSNKSFKSRNVLISDTSITFSDCYTRQWNTTSANQGTIENQGNIPLEIYGISKYSELDLKDDSKVSKSGDTMTGDLTLNNHHFRIKKPNTNISASSIESNQYAVMGATDINDNFLGYVQAVQYTDGSTLMQIAARNKKTGETSTFDNGLGLRCNKDGTKTVSLGDTTAWRNALGLTWTKAGSATNTSTVTIPATATEVMATVQPGTNDAIFTAYCLKSALKSIWFIGGYYMQSGDYSIINLNVSNSSRTFQLRNVIYGNGANLKSNSTLTIYYR